MYHTPYESDYYRKLYRQYGIDPNDGTLKELKEEFKTLAASDWLAFVKRLNYGMPDFQASDTVRKWMKNSPTFCEALSFFDCFFDRYQTNPFPERKRFRRFLPGLRQEKTKKKYGNQIHRDIERELRGLRVIAKRHKRKEDVKKIRAVKLATFVIFHEVRIYYVESAPKRINERLFEKLCAAAPAAGEIYRRMPDGKYTTKRRLPIGRILGQAGADVILIDRLERFSKYMGYLK